MVLKFIYAAFIIGVEFCSCNTFCSSINCWHPFTRRKFFSTASSALALQRRIMLGPCQCLTRRVLAATSEKQFSMMLVLEKLRQSPGASLSFWTVKVSSSPSSRLAAALGQEASSVLAILRNSFCASAGSFFAQAARRRQRGY